MSMDLLLNCTLVSPFCGITKDSMPQGPQVADMECRETAWPVVSTYIDGDPSHHHRGQDFQDGIHHTIWISEGSGPCSMRYKSVLW